MSFWKTRTCKLVAVVAICGIASLLTFELSVEHFKCPPNWKSAFEDALQSDVGTHVSDPRPELMPSTQPPSAQPPGLMPSTQTLSVQPPELRQGPPWTGCADAKQQRREDLRCGPDFGNRQCKYPYSCCNLKWQWCGHSRSHCPPPLGDCPETECKFMNSSSPSKEVMPGGDAVRPLSYSSTSLPRAIHVGCLDCSDTLVIARQDESMEGMEDLLSGFKVAVYGNLSSDSEKIDCLGKQVWLTSKTLNYDVPYFPTEHLRYIAYIITEYDNLGEFTLFVSKPRHDRKDIKSVKRIWAAKDVIKKCSDYFRLVGQGPQKSGSSLFKAVSDYFRVNWLDFLQPYLGWAVHRNVIRALGLSFWRSLYDRLAASSIYSPFVDSSSGLQVGQIMEHDWWQLLSGVCRSKLPQVSGTDTTPSRRRGDALAQAETTPNGASRSTKSWTNVGDALFGPTSRRCSDVSKKQREERDRKSVV